MKEVDIAPFALPNCEAGEIRFEEPRDIVRVVITFAGVAPRRIGLLYLKKKWPQIQVENRRDLESPFSFGWTGMDDWFNCEWWKAAVSLTRETKSRVIITFRPLSWELPEMREYDVAFRRTLGVRLDVPDPRKIKVISVFTASKPTNTRLRVELDAGRKTQWQTIRFDGYNAYVRKVTPVTGVTLKGDVLHRRKAARCSFGFELSIAHMCPAHRYAGDDGHVRFILENDSFTISLSNLDQQGPIWFADKGFFITQANDLTTFSEYCAACRKKNTVAKMVMKRPEQTYAGAFLGQPRPHAVAYSLGCKYARQRFWLEPNGDVVLHKRNIKQIPGKDTPRYANQGNGRFFYGLEKWSVLGRHPDPAPALAYNIRLRHGGLKLEQKSFAVPLERSILEGELSGGESIICMQRFRFTNIGDTPVTAELPVKYSQNSNRSPNPYAKNLEKYDDWLVPKSKLEKPRVKGNCVYGVWKGESALRYAVDSAMAIRQSGKSVVMTTRLQPGETCEAVIKIPFIGLDTRRELQLLNALDFERCHTEMTHFWRREVREGAQIHTPVPQLNDLHMAHLAHVQITDFVMPKESHLINTSVGASTYGNFSNESCMINQELDQRGLLEDVRRRLATWVQYQGTVPQPGNFTDYDGMYFGAGGFESGAYNQQHGWILWRISEHFLYSGDRVWFRDVAESVIEGANWVFRQRRNTMQQLPHSRGWEYGFLPAGSLEDVTDFFYWLSTNALTWRGVDTTARALEAYGHTEAKRIRREADAYARDLRRGFETMRWHSPVVRLQDGRWVPHYPSRLYCRGRDLGWIREVLEGSVYLLISGLYDPKSRETSWILDDYQDTRYMSPPFGYNVVDPEKEWYNHGGFSCQPNLLAGLLPYLDRDKPELYIWMFFNAWCACYREEIGAMVEHPTPVLGYSNCAHFKTSDQANAVMWLRYMFVYTIGDTLHFGRAVPRAWFAAENQIGAESIRTVFGTVGISYKVDPDGKRMTAITSLKLRRHPGKILVRFRHKEKKPIRSVKVNGKTYKAFDPKTGDVDLTGCKGRVRIDVRYA